MTEPLTPAEIAELQAVAVATTPGKREAVKDNRPYWSVTEKATGEDFVLADFAGRDSEANARCFAAFAQPTILRLLDSHEVLRQRADAGVRALRSAKALCDNINEFGSITDAIIYDEADAALRAALPAAAAKDEVR